MGAPLTRRTLLSLVLTLLFPSMAAMGSCSKEYHVLLDQLQKQADLMQDTSSLLDPYIRIQGLDVPKLREHCREHPGAFPSEEGLQGLDRRGFLQTLNATLGHVMQRLAALEQQLPKAQDLKRSRLNTEDLEKLQMARPNVLGLRNNVYCMAQLRDISDTAESTTAGRGTTQLPVPVPASDSFQRKLEGCRFLHGYHRFMHSVGRVFRKWRESPSRSRRHSPRRAVRKEVRRTRPSRRGKRLMPGGQLPR
ncbi:oncostatin-M [Saimiri boliviensis]|uniref:Oncostatin M n=1 Tax=Saimiri boliviensis boliviensis TaxID=39432 RepID=A0A2K6TF58_SAIBB|nr:oncostatin-M isoform X1 [Saimiri boliviensis boliviensis]